MEDNEICEDFLRDWYSIMAPNTISFYVYYIQYMATINMEYSFSYFSLDKFGRVGNIREALCWVQFMNRMLLKCMMKKKCE